MHFGATLRLLRLESGLSLRDLARRLDVSGAYLSRVENGVDSIPTSARLEAIARELDIPAPLLMGLAHRVSPLVVDYVGQVPEAGALFLEIAHRRLDRHQLALVHDFLDANFRKEGARSPAPRSICDSLSLDRVIFDLSCCSIDDVLDVAASRLSTLAGKSAQTISSPLKTREREVTSAIGSGVAVPCAYIEGIDPVAVLVTLAEPLNHETPDGQPLSTIFVLAGPRHSLDRKLTLAHLARLSARGLAERLAEARSPADLLSLLALLEATR
jgi:nitrogen PTS system EIIA component